MAFERRIVKHTAKDQETVVDLQRQLAELQFGLLNQLIAQQQQLFGPNSNLSQQFQSIGKELDNNFKTYQQQFQAFTAGPQQQLHQAQQRVSAAGEKIAQDIQSGRTASPEDRAAIDEAANRALALGESDINRFITQGIEQAVTRMSPARGFRASDTPIGDVVGRDVLAEGARSQADLVNAIRGGQAQAYLDYPLARRQADIAGATALGQQAEYASNNLGQYAGFAEQLNANRMAGTAARMNVLGSLSDLYARGQQLGIGLGLGGALGGGMPNVAGTLAQYGAYNTTNFDQFNRNLGGFSNTLTGIGTIGNQVGSFASALGGMFMGSPGTTGAGGAGFSMPFFGGPR